MSPLIHTTNTNKAGFRLFGGIVANTDSRNFTGRWMVYKGNGKEARADDWKEWSQVTI